MSRTSKVKSAEEAFKVIQPGMSIAMTCAHYSSVPMGAMRQLIRMGAKDLTIIPTPSAGLAIDLLIAAGCVKKVFASYVGLEFLGLAPNYRRAVEQNTIEVSDIDETSIVLGYRAAATGLPFALLPAFYKLTDLPRINPEMFHEIKDPFTGNICYAMPPLKPDVAILHFPQCDAYGNARQLGGHHTEKLIAKASDHVIITTEEIIPHEDVMADPVRTTVPGLLVDSVVKLPYGAHPGSCPARYSYDEKHLTEYAQLAREGKSSAYIRKYVTGPKDHYAYLDMIGAERLMELKVY
jgi:glutaconate CoA-transferase, subunit A